jgi:hypothetical protein
LLGAGHLAAAKLSISILASRAVKAIASFIVAFSDAGFDLAAIKSSIDNEASSVTMYRCGSSTQIP